MTHFNQCFIPCPMLFRMHLESDNLGNIQSHDEKTAWGKNVGNK